MIDFDTRTPISFHDGTPLSWYSSALAVRFCPYLKAAERSRLLYQSRYKLTNGCSTVREEDIFSLGVLHTEAFRLKRRGLGAAERVLLCDNLVLAPGHRDTGWCGQELLAWPHWVLKCLYTRVEVMFGKFWASEVSTARNGLVIPSPPCDFLSIRTSVKAQDPRFFTQAEDLVDDLVMASDNGQNVHEPFTTLDPAGFTLESLREIRYYDTVRAWAAGLTPKTRTPRA